MLDGELVIRDAEGNLEFDALQSRIHPAESRITLLSKEIPAGFVAFDLLAEGDESLLETPFGERRERLERAARRAPRIEISMLSRDPEQAEEWLRRTEGTMAKQLDAPYIPGKRKGMAKVKRERDDRLRGDGLAPGQGGGHGRLADPRPLRRRRAALGRPHLRLQRTRPNAACAPCSNRWRPARAAPPSRAAGPAAATSSG